MIEDSTSRSSKSYFWAMAKSRKNASSTDTAEEPSFEQALARLESIVSAMESDELALDALLENYREGTRLSAICQQKLAQAEVLIQRLDDSARDGDIDTAHDD